jgi:ketosteroid isomerase-like protein
MVDCRDKLVRIMFRSFAPVWTVRDGSPARLRFSTHTAALAEALGKIGYGHAQHAT